jgi:hypothetical protein
MQSESRSSQLSYSLERGAVVLIFCIGWFGYLMQTTSWLSAIPGDYSDARFNSVVLEHLFQWLRGGPVSLWNPSYFYPFKNILGFSDNHFGSGWAYAIFRAIGVEREYAYIGWFLIGSILNYAASLYVLRRFGFSLFASAAGAFVYAFGLPSLIQEAHAQLNYRFAVPLAFFSFARYLDEKNPQYLAKTSFWIAVQFYCTIYLGVFLSYLLVAVLLAAIVATPKTFFRATGFKQKWFDWPNIGAGLLGCLSILAVVLLLLKYRSVKVLYGFGSADFETTYMLPRFSSYLLADYVEVSRWLGQQFAEPIPSSYRHEHQLFFGFGVWVLAIMGTIFAWRCRSEHLGKITSVSFALLVILTIDISGSSLYWWLLKVPGLSAVRAVSRIGMILLLPMSIMVTIMVDYFVKSSWYPIRRYRFVLLVVSIVAITYETTAYRPYHYPIQAWYDRQIRLQKLIEQPIQSGEILYLTNAANDPWDTVAEIDAMIYAQDHRVPTLNGYSGRSPPRIRPNHPCVSFESRLQSYFDFANISRQAQDDYIKRVRVISPEACLHAPGLVATKQFDRDQASAIRLSANAERVGDVVEVALTITNQSAQDLHAISKEWPIRLSWRFVPLDAQGIAITQPGWDARKDLYFSIAAGQTHLEYLTIPMPKRSELLYALEVSLVQEGYYWFHDAGMAVATIQLQPER